MFQPQLPADPIIRDNLRRWYAHHKRYQYVELPPIPHVFHVGAKEVTNFATHLRRHKLDHGKKYTGKVLRSLRAERGCSKPKPKKPRQQLRIAMPWNPKVARVVAFNIERDESGKPFFDNVQLIRYTNRARRDKRLENSLTSEQWLMIFKRLARQMFPKDGADSWKDAVPSLTV